MASGGFQSTRLCSFVPPRLPTCCEDVPANLLNVDGYHSHKRLQAGWACYAANAAARAPGLMLYDLGSDYNAPAMVTPAEPTRHI